MNNRDHFEFDPPTGMLAHALSRSYAQGELTSTHNDPQLSLPLTASLPVHPNVTMQVENEEDENDGIDFRRLRAELDRLLDEDLAEADDDEIEEPEDTTMDVFYKIGRPNTTTKIYRVGRLSRSL